MSDACDGGQPKACAPSPHGEAALLLVESLIHGLAAKSVLTIQESVSIMEVALEAQIAIAEHSMPSAAGAPDAAHLLSRLVQSLTIDLPVNKPSPANED